MSDVAGALDRMRLAVGETDALAAIAVAWFDGVDQSDADPVLVERIGYLLDVIARSAATAASKVDSVQAAVADAQPARAPAGEAWDYHKGTSPGGDRPMPEQDAAIVRRLRTLCQDGRFDGHTDDALIHLFRRNQQAMRWTEEQIMDVMTRPAPTP